MVGQTDFQGHFSFKGPVLITLEYILLITCVNYAAFLLANSRCFLVIGTYSVCGGVLKQEKKRHLEI